MEGEADFQMFLVIVCLELCPGGKQVCVLSLSHTLGCNGPPLATVTNSDLWKRCCRMVCAGIGQSSGLDRIVQELYAYIYLKAPDGVCDLDIL